MAVKFLIAHLEGAWHRVTDYEDVDVNGDDGSRSITRSYQLGCGEVILDGGDRMEETETEPGGVRHVAKGCFKKQTPASER